jgi:hypothetical protein
VAKFVLPIPIFLAYLIPLDVDVTGNITAKICEVWSEFKIFCTFVIMATSAILNVGIFTVVCGSFWRVDKIQNGGRCHGNQGAIFFLFIPNFKKLYSNVSCHIQICKQRY